MVRILSIMAVALVFATSVVAVEPDEVLSDPALEARARALSAELRCLVCRNQSIDDSNAELARDLRLLVRERLVEGDSNEEAMDFIVARYGTYVLLKPPFQVSTWALWIGPLFLFLAAGFGFSRLWRRRPSQAPDASAKMSENDRALLAAALMMDDDK
jgi:cytochrome c-type biogenesis protein CcmH